jgi:uncharacterized protein with HEPN domain
MPHDVKTCLSDIQTSIDSIDDYLTRLNGKRDYNIYLQDKLLRRGIERELEIIGEATKRIRNADPDFPLENVREIIGLRNWIAHAYDNTRDSIVWGIVIKHLTPLRKEVGRLLEQAENQSAQ